MPVANLGSRVGKRLNRWKIGGGWVRTCVRMRRPETRFGGSDFITVIGPQIITSRVRAAVQPERALPGPF